MSLYGSVNSILYLYDNDVECNEHVFLYYGHVGALKFGIKIC